MALHADDHRLGEARRKPLAVLAYLAVEADPETERAVNREALAALLWPDVSPERARRTLAQTLYALRRECGADVVLGTSQLTINADVIASDVRDFLRAGEAGDHAAALACYRGPFLDGVAFAGAVEFEHWAERVRERIAAMHGDMIRARANARPRSSPASMPASSPAEPLDFPATVTPRRRARGMLDAPRAVVGGVIGMAILALAAALLARSPARPRPETLHELAEQSRRARLEARIASIDTAHLGRVVVLPPRNVTGQPAYDSVLRHMSWWIYTVERQTLFQTVPESITVRLDRELRATNMPTTTTMQIAELLRTTQAALAIQPLLSRAKGDSLRVSFVFYRDLSRTRVAERGSSNLETITGPATSAVAVNGNRAASDAVSKLYRWLRSTETCDPDEHVGYETAPWCWIEGKQLGVVVGVDERQRRVVQR
ncbi:hypothetical protein [Gemmatimonas groenlandica]|uniref:Bacterial transcriptional activator domain-containing protein n=1 Tax=Gemmatimonas groenlandica TaxID=2732249 RepID=A0A6M4IMR8_9BACT|nr:hypothetical protein [Gemmatimonas groenlandica]QJR34706.1 hypothetical protein HKW67_03850 [Gemmatimonas groenlandica]